MRCGWALMGVVLVFMVGLIWAILKSAAMRERSIAEKVWGKSADKKQKCTPESSDTSGQSLNGTREKHASSMLAKRSRYVRLQNRRMSSRRSS